MSVGAIMGSKILTRSANVGNAAGEVISCGNRIHLMKNDGTEIFRKMVKGVKTTIVSDSRGDVVSRTFINCNA